MIKKIKLLQNTAIYDDRKEFVIVDNDNLEFCIENKYPTATPYLVGNINDYYFTYKFENGRIKFKNDELMSGVLHSVIEIRENDTTIKRYILEPLKISQIKQDKELIPEIEELKKEIETIKGYRNEVEKYLKLLGKLYNVDLKLGGKNK